MKFCGLAKVAGRLAAFTLFGVVPSCTPDAPKPESTGTITKPVAQVNKPAQPKPAVASSNNELPVIPDDAEWTILAYGLKSPTHIEDANDRKAEWVRKSGRSDWYVIHGRDSSNIYFGYYKCVNDPANPKESARARADREMVERVLQADTHIDYKGCGFIQLAAPDPTAPPDWNLFNVDRNKDPKDPTRAYWSLQIMAFRGVPERKEAAVAAVRDLRSQGIPAYYYHGESISSVCIGAWPPEALKAQNRTEKMPDMAHSSAATDLIVTAEPLPENLKPKPIGGRPTVAVSPRLEVLDKSMLDTCLKFPHHSTNYVQGRKLPNGQEVNDPSFVVIIPRAPGNGLYDADTIAGSSERPRDPAGAGRDNAIVGPLAPGGSSSTPGSLRRIGGN